MTVSCVCKQACHVQSTFSSSKLYDIIALYSSHSLSILQTTFCIVVCPQHGPRVVVSTAAFHARVRGSVPGLGGLKETKTFLPHPRVKVSIVGSLREFRILCLEDSVISIILPSLGGSPCPV